MTDAAPGALPRRAWQRTVRAARSPWWRGTRERKALLAAEVVLIGLVGLWLGLLAGGGLNAHVGPLNTKLSIEPSVSGGSQVSIQPTVWNSRKRGISVTASGSIKVASKAVNQTFRPGKDRRAKPKAASEDATVTPKTLSIETTTVLRNSSRKLCAFKNWRH